MGNGWRFVRFAETYDAVPTVCLHPVRQNRLRVGLMPARDTVLAVTQPLTQDGGR